jgi:hypothetical protein
MMPFKKVSHRGTLVMKKRLQSMRLFLILITLYKLLDGHHNHQRDYSMQLNQTLYKLKGSMGGIGARHWPLTTVISGSILGLGVMHT